MAPGARLSETRSANYAEKSRWDKCNRWVYKQNTALFFSVAFQFQDKKKYVFFLIPGYSQGGLVARALIQSTNKHNIHTFVSLSSPQGGQYGGKPFFLYFLKEKIEIFCTNFFL